MPSGAVKWFNANKGFGFIVPDDGGADVFLHISAVEAAGHRNFAEGQRLTYELVVDRQQRSSAGNLVVEGELLPVQPPAPRRDFGGGERPGGFRGPPRSGGGGFGGPRNGGGGFGGGGYRGGSSESRGPRQDFGAPSDRPARPRRDFGSSRPSRDNDWE